MTAAGNRHLLEVIDLQAGFTIGGRFYPAIDHISLQVEPGKVTCLVGESGSGKSVLALSIMDLLPKDNGRRTRGEIRLNGRNLMGWSDAEMNRVRGKEIGFVFQEPLTALNPIGTVGSQIQEALRNHKPISRRESRAQTIDLLRQVGILRPEAVFHEYPHQLSGGMRQRVMIAMAIACEPQLLIADEPTTALDVSVQAQILALFKSLQQQRGMAILLITHNLGVVAEMADEVIVMYAGEIVEQGDVDRIFHEPKHPYLQQLLQLIPRLDREYDRFASISGNVPSLLQLPPVGCRFAPRCPEAMDRCFGEKPPMTDTGANHLVRCLLYPGDGAVGKTDGGDGDD